VLDRHVDLHDWAGGIPQEKARVPAIRIGRRWFSTLWLVPICVAGLVEGFTHLGLGHGGYNEDHEFYGHRMPI
jgi:hypothetical protein